MSSGCVVAKSDCPAALSASEFTERVCAAARGTTPSLDICVRGPLAVDVQADAGMPWTENLARAYEVYVAEPLLLDDLVRLRAASMLDMATVTATASSRHLLLPVLWVRGAFAGSTALCNTYSDTHVTAWIVDVPGQQHFVTPDILDRLGMSVDDLGCVAAENLARRIDEVDVESIAHGVVRLASATLPTSSLLLVPSLRGQSQFSRMANLSAIAIDRGALLVFDAADPKSRHVAVSMARSALPTVGPLSSLDVVTLRAT